MVDIDEIIERLLRNFSEDMVLTAVDKWCPEVDMEMDVILNRIKGACIDPIAQGKVEEAVKCVKTKMAEEAENALIKAIRTLQECCKRK